MNDKMKSDIERLLAEGERLAVEQGKTTIVTKPCRSPEIRYWWSWISDDPNLVYIGATEAEAIGMLIMSQSNRLGILLKREVP